MTRAGLLFLLLAALSPLAGQDATRISADAPIINFRLPMYQIPDGYRTWLVRGSEARVANNNSIDVKGLTLSIFGGTKHDQVETLILSPACHLRPDDQVATGAGSIRVVNDQYEAAGNGWIFAYRDKKVSIAHDVRVVLHGELKGFLQ